MSASVMHPGKKPLLFLSLVPRYWPSYTLNHTNTALASPRYGRAAKRRVVQTDWALNGGRKGCRQQHGQNAGWEGQAARLMINRQRALKAATTGRPSLSGTSQAHRYFDCCRGLASPVVAPASPRAPKTNLDASGRSRSPPFEDQSRPHPLG